MLPWVINPLLDLKGYKSCDLPHLTLLNEILLEVTRTCCSPHLRLGIGHERVFVQTGLKLKRVHERERILRTRTDSCHDSPGTRQCFCHHWTSRSYGRFGDPGDMRACRSEPRVTGYGGTGLGNGALRPGHHDIWLC